MFGQIGMISCTDGMGVIADRCVCIQTGVDVSGIMQGNRSIITCVLM